MEFLIGSKLEPSFKITSLYYCLVRVISLESIRQVKESCELAMDAENVNSVKLLEVTDKNASNMLTNNPDFFSTKNNSSQSNTGYFHIILIKVSGKPDTEEDTDTDVQNDT